MGMLDDIMDAALEEPDDSPPKQSTDDDTADESVDYASLAAEAVAESLTEASSPAIWAPPTAEQLRERMMGILRRRAQQRRDDAAREYDTSSVAESNRRWWLEQEAATAISAAVSAANWQRENGQEAEAAAEDPGNWRQAASQLGMLVPGPFFPSPMEGSGRPSQPNERAARFGVGVEVERAKEATKRARCVLAEAEVLLGDVKKLAATLEDVARQRDVDELEERLRTIIEAEQGLAGGS